MSWAEQSQSQAGLQQPLDPDNYPSCMLLTEPSNYPKTKTQILSEFVGLALEIPTTNKNKNKNKNANGKSNVSSDEVSTKNHCWETLKTNMLAATFMRALLYKMHELNSCTHMPLETERSAAKEPNANNPKAPSKSYIKSHAQTIGG